MCTDADSRISTVCFVWSFWLIKDLRPHADMGIAAVLFTPYHRLLMHDHLHAIQYASCPILEFCKLIIMIFRYHLLSVCLKGIVHLPVTLHYLSCQYR
jgi:hypothetical protein